MASNDPSGDEISQVIDFANLNPVDDREMVIIALKNNSRNVESVVTQYFDNADNFRQKYAKIWDDTMFGADRDGSANTSGIAFHIESPTQNDVIQGVTPPPEGYGPGAPSRPPSRTNNKSPLGRMVDWTAGEATGLPESQNQEDEDMQRALRESAQEAGIEMPQQESGIANAPSSGGTFGPANRNDYETANWAMVPTAVDAKQTVLDGAPPPSQRKRDPEAPAFLVQGLTSNKYSHYLGALLTILHEIPLARNILLRSGEPPATYGYTSDWWKGQEIIPPHVLALLQSGELEWGAQEVAKPVLEEEVHRLMAFLDQTERSYGTVSVLNDSMSPQSGVAPEKLFYEQLSERNEDLIRPLSQTASISLVLGDDDSEKDAHFGLLELGHQRADYEHIKTLYEAIDHVMWGDAYSWDKLDRESRMAMFEDMGEVLAIKIEGEGPADSFEIPAELYPERWLSSRKDEARRIQKAWCETKNAISEARQKSVTLCEYTDSSSGQVLDKREVLKTAGERCKALGEYIQGKARFRAMQESGFDKDHYADYQSAPVQLNREEEEQLRKLREVTEWTEEALADLQGQMTSLESHFDKLTAKMRFLGRLLTEPEKPGRPQPMTCKKYLLRGVATTPDTVYVCRRSEADLIELDDAPASRDQWWKLSYDPRVNPPVAAEKMDLHTVMSWIWHETKSPMFIYATEAAVDEPRDKIEGQLERFVRADNIFFRQELSKEVSGDAGERTAEPSEALSPTKRKYRADSFDSLDSNRASIGSDGGNGFADPFADQVAPAPAAEMVDMSGRDEIEMKLETETVDSRPQAGVGSMVAQWNAMSNGDAASSHTATPNTLSGVGDHETPLIHRKPMVPISPETNPAAAAKQAKAPEMQEMARPPAFMTLSRSASESKSAGDAMDMEIPEHHE